MLIGNDFFSTRPLARYQIANFRVELAPLPGLHVENLILASAQFETIISSLDDISHLSLFLAKNHSLLPSVRFTLEGLYLEYLAKFERKKFLKLLGVSKICCVPLNALFVPTFDLERDLSNYQKLINDQFKCIKIKIGRLPTHQFIQEVELLIALDEISPPEVKWRIDGNQRLSASQLVTLQSSLSPQRMSYFESPLKKGEIPLSPFPIGHDEEVTEILARADKSEQDFAFDYFIIKPNLILGPLQLLALAQRPLANRIVLSSCFEGHWGLKILFWLAQSLNHGLAMGIDTIKYFNFNSGIPELSTHSEGGFLFPFKS